MTRAVSVLVATLVLLGVGWFLGHRPVNLLENQLAALEEQCAQEVVRLSERARHSEARGYLWQARARLLLAKHEIDLRNFGSASEHAMRARDLITQTSAIPGVTLDLVAVHQMVESAIGKIMAMDAASEDVIMRAANELGRLLERVGQA
jgi:hypothetical protein